MKHLFRSATCLVALLFLSVLLVSAKSNAVVNPKPFVIPEIQEWKGAQGAFIPTDMDDARIVFKTVKSKKLPVEGYIIDVTRKGVTVTAADERGFRWARQTMAQIMEQTENHALPCGTIRDYPLYGLRGFMLDCGRKFIPTHVIRDVVDMMAYHKMNTLHLHLNDNGFKQYFNNDWASTPAAFRLECDTYPGLAAADGYYTKREFIELQEYAADKGVEIIPEIDVPAHCLAFTHYRPDLGSAEFGMDHLNLRNPDVYPFLDALFKEYLEGDEPVFRGHRVNIGTDEYSNRDSVIVEEFRRFTDHYIRYVESFGKQAVFWGSLTHANGVTPVKADGVLMNCWYNGYANPKVMKEAGYDLVSIPDGYVYIVPAAGYYYDYLNCQFLYNEWTPAQIGDQKFEECDPAIKGGMFAVWNDHAGNGISCADILHRVWPAMQTISAKTWTASRITIPYETFDSLRHQVAKDLKRQVLGIDWPYTVTFDIEGAAEEPGTVLYADGDTRFYLADPMKGLVGFSRDGYLFTFDYRVLPGHHTISIQGTNEMTRLIVDGQVRGTLQRRWKFYGKEGKDKMAEVPTFMFPVDGKEGAHKSIVSNLRYTNTLE